MCVQALILKWSFVTNTFLGDNRNVIKSMFSLQKDDWLKSDTDIFLMQLLAKEKRIISDVNFAFLIVTCIFRRV